MILSSIFSFQKHLEESTSPEIEYIYNGGSKGSFLDTIHITFTEKPDEHRNKTDHPDEDANIQDTITFTRCAPKTIS